jgi:pimeloyl-ACP methyl ester carboxylesterase
MMRFLLLLLLIFVLDVRATVVIRDDQMIDSTDGVRLHLRHISNHSLGRSILLVHGARMAAVASFDLPVEGGSLAVDLAAAGFDVYLLDVRGYGSSSRPADMQSSPEGKPALVRSNEAVQDIDAAIKFIRARTKNARVTLLGWASGGQWAGHYASLHSENLSGLIVLNSLYRGVSPHALIGRGSGMEDPAQPGHYNRVACGAYRFSDETSIMRPWDASIPGSDKSAWRDPAVAQAFVTAALAADETSQQRSPASARSPCGAMEDSFYLATGRQLWDASLITVPVLAMRGERDFWSRPEDLRNLLADLVHAPGSRSVTLQDTSHYVHLERASKGREHLLQEIKTFVFQAKLQP